MRKVLLGLALALGLTLIGTTPSAAFVEDTPPTFENGGVDPNRTADPPAVAAAQKTLAEFFAYTNREYSLKGYLNARVMREELGNGQGDWLDKTMNLACGRLVGGWHFLNWLPNQGWCRCAVPAFGATVSPGPVACEYGPPTAGQGGVDPNLTIDPPVVAASQKALVDFYRVTNRTYSIKGYANPQLMREILGNEQSDWLDQSLALARGQLVGGWKGMNWMPGRGWCHCSASAAALAARRPIATEAGLTPADGGGAEVAGLLGVSTTYYEWEGRTVAQRSDERVKAYFSRAVPAARPADDRAASIQGGLGVRLGGDEDR